MLLSFCKQVKDFVSFSLGQLLNSLQEQNASFIHQHTLCYGPQDYAGINDHRSHFLCNSVILVVIRIYD